MLLGIWFGPSSIHVVARNATPVVSIDHSVRTKHRYNLEDKLSSQLACYFRIAQQVIDAADLLIKEGGEQGGRLLSLNFHPWLVGQPHRIRTIREILEALLVERGEAIWHAPPGHIIRAAKT